MLDSSDCTLSLDSLFFEKPIVHEVWVKQDNSHHPFFLYQLCQCFSFWNAFDRKPLHQEASQWQLEVPPSLSQIPATPDLQQESFSTLNSMLGSGLG